MVLFSKRGGVRENCILRAEISIFIYIWNPKKGKVGNLSLGSDCQQVDIWVLASQASWLKLFKCHQPHKLHFFFPCLLISCPVSAFNVHCVRWNSTWIMSQVAPPISLFRKVHASETTLEVPAHCQEAQKEYYQCWDKVIKRKITWKELFLEMSFSVVIHS